MTLLALPGTRSREMPLGLEPFRQRQDRLVAVLEVLAGSRAPAGSSADEEVAAPKEVQARDILYRLHTSSLTICTSTPMHPNAPHTSPGRRREGTLGVVGELTAVLELMAAAESEVRPGL